MFEIDKEYLEKIEIVKNHFGIAAQESYIWNELQELKEATEIYKKGATSFEISSENRENVISEIADVYFMGIQIDRKELIETLILYFLNYIFYSFQIKVVLEAIKKEMYFKIDRTLDRIETGYYESV